MMASTPRCGAQESPRARSRSRSGPGPSSDSRRIPTYRLPVRGPVSLNGTDLRPIPLIQSRSGEFGVASYGDVAIELPPEHPRPDPRFTESFPQGRGRTFHTVTPLAGRFIAVVAGGKANDTGEILDDVLVYNLFVDGLPNRPRWVPEGHLPRPTFQHTATLVSAGERSHDAFIVVAGGWDGNAPIGDLTIIRLGVEGEGSEVVIEKLDVPLLVPRWGHRAIAVGDGRIVIDGGWTRERGENRLVGATEIFDLERKTEIDELGKTRVRIEAHRTAVHSLPREDTA